MVNLCQWRNGTVRNNSEGLQHMRMPADATFYFLKRLRLNASRGLDHPEWEKAAISNLDAFTRLWREHKDFGHKSGPQYTGHLDRAPRRARFALGAWRLAPIYRAERHISLLRRRRAQAFYERYVQTGWIVGGPLDIPNAPDSESVTALLESYVTMYEVTRESPVSDMRGNRTASLHVDRRL